MALTRILPVFISIFVATIQFSTCSQPRNPVLSEIKRIDLSFVDKNLLEMGPLEISEFDYSLPAAVDPLVPVAGTAQHPEVKVQVAGRGYFPKAAGPHPLLVFLHGNHATCGLALEGNEPRVDFDGTYTFTGICPEGMIPVPNHLGYDFAARLLASHGYAVVSIDANRGITYRNLSEGSFDRYLVRARGNLVLRNLVEISRWNTDGIGSAAAVDFDLRGQFDLSQVGFMGHSRGGEGVRVAQNIFLNEPIDGLWHKLIPDLNIRAVFEIAPVDLGTLEQSPVTPKNIAWNVLIAACDGDVVTYQGVSPWHRAMTTASDGYPKSVFTVWGANHNFFNSEWQTSDSRNCSVGQRPLFDVTSPLLAKVKPELVAKLGSMAERARSGVKGSEAQIKIGAAAMLAFFKANVGLVRIPEFARLFDPQFALPSHLAAVASISRSYTSNADSKIAVFKSATDPTTVSGGLRMSSLTDYIELTYLSFIASISTVQEMLGDAKEQKFLRSGAPLEDAVILTADLPSSIDGVWDIPLETKDLSAFWTLDFVLSVRGPCPENLSDPCHLGPATDAFIELVIANGSVSKAVRLSEYVKLKPRQTAHFRKTGTTIANDIATHRVVYMPVLFDTVRIELSDFEADLTQVRGIRLRPQFAVATQLIVDDIILSK